MAGCGERGLVLLDTHAKPSWERVIGILSCGGEFSVYSSGGCTMESHDALNSVAIYSCGIGLPARAS